MIVQPVHNNLETIMQRIDTMIEELYALRKAVQVLGKKDDPSVKIDLPTPPQRRSALDILDAAPGKRLFSSAQEVNAYIAEERSSWD